MEGATPMEPVEIDDNQINLQLEFEKQSKRESEMMPKYKAPETFDQKLYRKFSEEPLIPAGCALTTYYLASGMRSFYDRDMRKSQKMMRSRVTAQFVTLMIFIGYAGMSSFNLKIAPGYRGDEEKKE